MIDLKGKSILITAAATRTGAAMTRYLITKGADIFMVYRNNREGIDEIMNQFPQAKCFALQADVTDPEQVERMKNQIMEQTGQLYSLINVVGDYHEAPILDTDYEDFRGVISNNLDSVFLMCKHFHPLLKAQGNSRIINFAYAYGDRVAAAKPFAYHIAKMGVISLTKSMARQWGGDGISANVISPGHLFNSIVMESDNPEDMIPQGRFGSYEDIFYLLDMILREDSQYMTGSNLVSSGGYNL